MKVFHISAECYPVAKVGGLGDVLGALPKYLVQQGVEAKVVLPFYDVKFMHQNCFISVFKGKSYLGNRAFDFEILKEEKSILGFDLFVVKIPGFLDRTQVYSYPDESEQFIAFQIAFLEWVIADDVEVDIFHCHDHHTGFIPFLIKHSAKFDSLRDKPSVFTIHNAQYQGWLGWDKFYYLPQIDVSKTGLLEWDACINPLATAVKCCWKYTTVSPGYLQELQVNSNRLEHLFVLEEAKGEGIINGIDTDVWNPQTDVMIDQNYTIKTAKKDKKLNKQALCEEFSLDSSIPLVAFIGRLVLEKGADILPSLVQECLKIYSGQVSLLILGSGETEIEENLKQIPTSENYQVYIGYNEKLSHRVYASSDFILMPSRVEPCGLNQLYALKYGTIPMVRSTGGLKDTVKDIDENEGYGICFYNTHVDDCMEAIARAIKLYKKGKLLNEVRMKGMELNFSWNNSALQYKKLYTSLITLA